MKKKINKIQIMRKVVQLFFLIIVIIASFRHQLLGGGPNGSPPIDAICPFGGLESLYKFLASGTFIDKTFISNYILLGGVIALALIAGRYFCGWICALGTLQELFNKLGGMIFRRKFEIPEKLDKPMRFIKYGVLVWALYFTWQTGTLFIRPYDPFAAFAHIPSGWSELWGSFAVGFSVLLVSLAASMFYDRFFCKYACPMGAFLGIFSKLSFFRIKREQNTCVSCSLCNKKCPVDIKVMENPEVKSAECIGCLECVTACPTNKDTLKTSIAGKNIKPFVIAITGVLVYVGIVAGAQITGTWNTGAKTLEEAVSENGELNPDNIKGYMTLKEISETFKIDINTLYQKLGITSDKVPPETRAKEIAGLIGLTESEFDTQKIRDAVGEILGKESTEASSVKMTVENKEMQPEKITQPESENKKEAAETVKSAEVKQQANLPVKQETKKTEVKKETPAEKQQHPRK